MPVSTTPCIGGRCGPSRKDRTMNTRPIRQEEEIAIRQLVQDMQDAQNTKNGSLFASAFAPEHDYVAINGIFLPNQTRQQNARVHQRLYDESASAVAGRYGEVEVLLNVVGIRLLAAPRVAIVHVQSEYCLQDEAYGPDARWITVSPAQMRIRIVLKQAEREHEKGMVGNSDGAPILTLGTDDIHAAYERLRERGVRFLGEPSRYPWGVGVLLLDQDGSPILLQQELNRQ
jgi:uncharacterized protein (TIGR02246 family)